MVTMLTEAGLRWMEHKRQVAALRRLLQHEDNILEDIGLRRAEIERALALPQGSDMLRRARQASEASLRLDRRL